MNGSFMISDIKSIIIIDNSCFTAPFEPL